MSTKKSDLTLKNVAESSSANEIKAIAENAENEKVNTFEASANDVSIKPKKTAKTYSVGENQLTKGQINKETVLALNKELNSVSSVIKEINKLRLINPSVKMWLSLYGITNFCAETNSHIVRDVTPNDFLKDEKGIFSTLTTVEVAKDGNKYELAYKTDKRDYFFKPFLYTVASALSCIKAKKQFDDFKAGKLKKEESKKAKETKEENAKAAQKAKLFEAIKGLTKEEKMELLKTA